MTVEQMTQFPNTASPEQANLDAMLTSPTYRIAHEDPDLLNSNAMRGVRMLLEITKPDLLLETAGIESTIIVFGGARIVDQDTAAAKLAQAEQRLSETPDSPVFERQVLHAKQLVELSRFYDAAREFASLASRHGQCNREQPHDCSSHVIVTGWWAGNHGSRQPGCL